MCFSDRFLSRMKFTKGKKRDAGAAGRVCSQLTDTHTPTGKETKKKFAQLPLALILRLAADTVTVTEQRCEAKTSTATTFKSNNNNNKK